MYLEYVISKDLTCPSLHILLFFRSKTGAGDVEVHKYPFNIGRDLLRTIFESHYTGAPWPKNVNFLGKSIFLKVLRLGSGCF